MIALIDGDILIYRVGFASQSKNDNGEYEAIPVEFACARMDTAIENIMKGTNASSYTVFLTSADKSNFRFALYEEYKANRTAPKPIWYQELRLHLSQRHNAVMVVGMEADDAMGMAQNSNTIICSIDKDLDQIPGKHYDFVNDVMYDVSEEDGLRFFYLQLLMGDRVDNIPGIEGVGVKTAAAMLGDMFQSEAKYAEIARAAYAKKYGEDKGTALMSLYGKLLKIKRKEDEPLWEPPLTNIVAALNAKSQESLSEPS